MPTESTEGFELFVSIVEAGSISAAARGRGVPRETLSRHLGRLEERLGVRLLHRDTRRLVPTRAGAELYRRARPLVAAAAEAAEAVRTLDDVPRGLLRVSVPPGGGLVAQLCVEFAARWPAVQLEVLASARFVDLVAEQIDVAIRAGPLRDPRLVARQLWATDLVAVASPDYLDRHGAPATLADLADHDVVLGFQEGTRPEPSWPTHGGSPLPVAGRLASNDLGLRHHAVLSGRGIGMLPLPFVQEALRDGALRPVLPDRLGSRTSMSVVFVERAFMLPKVRAFVDHVVETFAGHDPTVLLQAADPVSADAS